MTTLAEIREALEAVRDHPLDTRDRPEAWRALGSLLDILSAAPGDGVIATPESLARALHMNGVGCVGRDAAPRHLTRASVVLAAIAGAES